jgi:hypothetical protein
MPNQAPDRLPQTEVGDFTNLWFLRICNDLMEFTMTWTEITRFF